MKRGDGVSIPEPVALRSQPVMGVDGARGGWVAATLSSGTPPEIEWFADFAAVLDRARRISAAVVGVDMPIGLPSDGPRESDREARRILGPRRSSLFPTPVRAVLDATDHADAVARSRAACGKGISVQTWNLVPAIRQVRAAVASMPDLVVVETHPETSFTLMAGQPLAPKKTSEGHRERVHALEAALCGIPSSASGERCRSDGDRRRSSGARLVIDPHALVDDAGLPIPARRRPSSDDLLDAIAAAWSARRHRDGTAVVLGDGFDTDGHPLTIHV